MKVIHDAELYNKLKAFLSEACEFLSNTYSKEKYKNEINGIQYKKGEEVPPFYFARETYLEELMIQKFGDLIELPTYEKLRKYIQKNEHIQKVVSWDEDLFNFIKFFLALTKEFKFDEEIFDIVYSKFKDYKFTGKRKALFICPLQSFNINTDRKEISLAEDIIIKEPNPIEIERIRRKDSFSSSSTTIWYPSKIKFVLEKVYETEGTIDEIYNAWNNEIKSQFQEVVTALRLFEKGNLKTPLTCFFVSLDWNFDDQGWCFLDWNGVGGSRIHNSVYDEYITPYSLTLKEDRVSEFQNFWKNFRKKEFLKKLKDSLGEKFEKKFEIAIRRFIYSFERKNPEDNLIDCMIAIEALFGTKKRERISTLTSLKMAFFLKSDKAQVKEDYSILKKGYSIRSAIVHGEMKGFSILEKEYKNLLEIRELLRLSMKKYVDGTVLEEKKHLFFEWIEMLEIEEGEKIIDKIFELKDQAKFEHSK